MPNLMVRPKVDRKEILEDQLGQVTKKYFLETSLHGIKYLTEAKRNIFERVFWFVAIVLSWAFAGYMIYRVIRKWEKSPVLVSFDSSPTPIWQVPFPALTICNMNKVRASQALRIQEELSQNPQSDWIKTEHLFVHEVCGHFNDDFLDDRDNLNLTGQALHHFLNELGQPCSDMLIRCRFEGLERNCTDIFVPVITDEGQCCSFNVMPESVMFRNEVDRDEAEEKRWSLWDMQSGYVEDPRQVQVDLPDEYLPRRALAPGLHMGLSVLLDVDEEEYYCSGTESVGFKALLHTPVTLPEMIEYGFAITPGTETFLAVSPKLIHADENIHGISYLKRQCYLTGEKDLSFFRHYTFLNCYMECVANYTFSACGCVDYYMPRNPDLMPICSTNKGECIQRAVTLVEKSAYSKFDGNVSTCGCLPPCSDMNFPHETSTSKLRGDLLKVSNQLKANRPSLLNKTYVENNLAIVNIFFKELHFMRHERGELFGITDFFSNIGGLLGLCMGFSMLSFVECGYFFTIRYVINKLTPRNESF